MESLTLGRLTLTAEKAGVTFVLAGEDVSQVTITARQVCKLEEFLKRYAPHERRLGFRVPLDSLSDEVQSDFKVRVRNISSYVKAKPIDMSLTGILLKSKKLRASLGTHVMTKLTLADDSCTLIGKVVRQDGYLWALHFFETVKNGELDPPEDLLSIYRSLETDWLKSRVAV